MAVGVLAAAPGALAAAPIAVNCSSMNLQSAIDNPSPGATLQVSGTCSGNYTINKNLTLVGHQTGVLDGQGAGTPLTVSAGATVQVTNLTLTNGDALDGGGINNSGTLTLTRSSVTSSFGTSGGGIFNTSKLTLDEATVSLNESGQFGGAPLSR